MTVAAARWRVLLLVVTAASSADSLSAQCGHTWQPGAGTAGPEATVHGLAELANGDLVAVGRFPFAGTAVTSNVARWDGAVWSDLDGGVGGDANGSSAIANAIAVLANGDVVVGGSFAHAGGAPAANLARRNGSSWSAFGDTNGAVSALTVLANGDLVIGGRFTTVGGVAANRVARFDGASWSALPGLNATWVYTIAELPSGDLVVGGPAGGSLVSGLARWDGVSWSPLAGVTAGMAYEAESLQVLPNGDVAIAGRFLAGTIEPVAIWNGAQLQVVPGPIRDVHRLALAANGDLLAGGGDPFGTFLGGLDGVARYDGVQWTALPAGAPDQPVALLVDAQGRLVVAGPPQGYPVAVGPAKVRRFDGTAWQSLGTYTAPPVVLAAVRLSDGDVVVGGSFAQLGGVPAANVARWNGIAWAPLGTGVGGTVTALAIDTNGDLLVGGSFLTAGGQAAVRAARWLGGSWSPVGSNLDAVPTSLAATALGTIVASVGTVPAQSLRRFDGATWSVLPTGFSVNQAIPVRAMALPTGDVAITGSFSAAGTSFGMLRYLTGFAAEPATAAAAIYVCTTSPAGEPVCLTTSAAGARIAVLQNGALQTIAPVSLPIGAGIAALLAWPDGSVVVGGSFDEIGGTPARYVARFAGGAWSEVGGGLGSGAFGIVPTADVLAASGSGELFVAGRFQLAGDAVAIGLARATPDCPASVASTGVGCVGSAGPPSLAAASLPWLGATFRATASGLAVGSLVLHVVGSQSLAPPLPLPLGASGCSLAVDPVLLDLLVPSGGLAEASLALPLQPAAVGLLLHSQLVGIELDPSLAIVQATSSNVLTLTLGAL